MAAAMVLLAYQCHAQLLQAEESMFHTWSSCLTGVSPEHFGRLLTPRTLLPWGDLQHCSVPSVLSFDQLVIQDGATLPNQPTKIHEGSLKCLSAGICSCFKLSRTAWHQC